MHAPISPGNDLGPFTQMAHLMNAEEVHRALAVTERMAGADWSFRGDYGSHEDVSRVREVLPFREALALFATMLITTARASRALLLQELHTVHDLEALLRWLGGEDSLRATAAALEDVERLLQ
jgi:hypothetical protein